MLNEKQLKLLKKQNTVVLSTANKDNQPRAIFVEATKVDTDTIFITDNHLGNTIENIKSNSKVFILAYEDDYSYIVYLSGNAIYHEDGDILEEIKNHPDNIDFKPKGVIEIKIEKVEEPLNI